MQDAILSGELATDTNYDIHYRIPPTSSHVQPRLWLSEEKLEHLKFIKHEKTQNDSEVEVEIPTEISNQLEDLKYLGKDWDCYGSNPISIDAINLARIFILKLYIIFDEIFDTFWVGPTVNSGVKIELTYKSTELGIWIEDTFNKNIRVLYMPIRNQEKKYIQEHFKIDEVDKIIDLIQR